MAFEPASVTVGASEGMQLFDAPLTLNHGFYSRGAKVGVAPVGSEWKVLDVAQVPTVFGVQSFLEVEAAALNATAPILPRKAWVSVSADDLSRLRASSKVALTGVAPVWSDPFLQRLLLFLLPLGGFAYGMYVRNKVFDGVLWRPVRQQALLAVPIAVVTVGTQVAGFQTAVSKYNLDVTSSIAVFLTMVGVTMIEGLCLPELSKRHVESRIHTKTTKRPPKKQQRAAA
jgi:hypothetical protein